jgi:hypothetical protein
VCLCKKVKQSLCLIIEALRYGDIWGSGAFGQIKYMKEGFKPKTEFIRDKKGLLTNNKTEIMNTWKEYFEQL